MDTNLLAVAVGNTRTAFAAFVEGELAVVRRAENADHAAVSASLAEVWRRLSGAGEVAAAGVCLREGLRDRVAAEVSRVARQGVRWVQPAGATPTHGMLQVPIPVRTEQPARTGLDRILAVAAAYEQMGKACCVVDAGTAVTVNLCSDRGEFLGGAIAPGVRAQLRSMHELAPALPETTLIRPSGTVGRSTEDAMHHGVYYGLRGLVKEVVENFATQIGTWPEVIATGGDAELLFGGWELVHAVSPDLVLYGVALAYVKSLEGAA